MKRFLELEFLLSFLLPLLGVACILFSRPITVVLPYLLGAAMTVGGGIRVLAEFAALRRAQHTFNLSSNFILLVLGIFFLIRGRTAMTQIGIIWALFGIWQSAASLERAANHYLLGEPFWGSLLLSLFRLAVAILLLHEPANENISHHVVLLGVAILADTARMPLRHLWDLLRSRRETESSR